MQTFGIIGLGNMGGAILRGLRASEAFAQADVFAYNPSPRDVDAELCDSAFEAAERADVIVLAVKPQIIDGVLAEIASAAVGKLVISVAAGKTTAYLEERLPGARVVRVMPNINAQVLAATSVYAMGQTADSADAEVAEAVFGTIGTITQVDEADFAAFTAVGSCSPAFSYMYIAALAQAGIEAGLPETEAYQVAASSVVGSATMLLAAYIDGRDPEDLVQAVCSPGGMTIEGVDVLRDRGFEDAVRDAVAAAIAKDKRL